MATKEVRNGNLIATVRTNLPNVGLVKLDTKSDGRKATFKFQGLDFVATSRLIVKELGLFNITGESEISKRLQGRLRGEIV